MDGDTNTPRNLFDSLHEEVMQSDLPEAEKNRRLSALLKASSRHVNLMLVGSTGSGKSSTINAMFDMSVAKVGIGVDPETKEIEKYDLGNLTIWDTPGLGDGVEEDKKHVEQIVRKLSEVDGDGKLLIDLVLVVLDASSKDLAVSYSVINDTLIPCLGKNDAQRILIALNQADMAMKGRHWDSEKNLPDPVLKGFLTKKANSVRQRVLDATGVSVNPVYYSAGYTEDDGEQLSPYNLSKLLYYILTAVPAEKRLALVDNLNEDKQNWVFNDDDMDYTAAVKQSFFEALLEGIGDGAERGAITGGCIIGIPGMILGGLVGGIMGGLHSLIIKPFTN
jgi:predicted GTPase